MFCYNLDFMYVNMNIFTAAQPAHVHTVTLQEFSRRMVGSDTMNAEQIEQIREQREVCVTVSSIIITLLSIIASLPPEISGTSFKSTGNRLVLIL